MIKMLKKMNVPNRLTMLRIALVPVFIVLMVLVELHVWKYMNYVALAVFVAAAVTDALDGRISRKNNLVTNFGKIMDPLADGEIVGYSKELVEKRYKEMNQSAVVISIN